ncbi:MAG: winged helix-turn-helix transcriptional regulator [Pseudaminobacter sp.]
MQLKKITKSSETPHRRWYNDACGTAHALELVGERWALLIVRELMFGPKRFSDLRADLPGISANILTQRLEGLERAGIVIRTKLLPPASTQVYELTPWGYESEPIFQALGRWAARSPEHDPSLPLSAASLMLSLRTMIDPPRAEGIDARIGFRLGGESFLAHLARGRIEIARAATDEADLVFKGAPEAVAAAIYGEQPTAALEAGGMLGLEGDRELAGRFVTLFRLPPKADHPLAATSQEG